MTDLSKQLPGTLTMHLRNNEACQAAGYKHLHEDKALGPTSFGKRGWDGV